MNDNDKDTPKNDLPSEESSSIRQDHHGKRDENEDSFDGNNVDELMARKNEKENDDAQDNDIIASPPKSTATTNSITTGSSILQDLIDKFQNQVPIQDRRYLARIYRQTFVGSDAVTVLTKLLQEYADQQHTAHQNTTATTTTNYHVTRAQGIALGIYVMQFHHLFEHVVANTHRQRLLHDDYYFYRFCNNRTNVFHNNNPKVSTIKAHDRINKKASDATQQNVTSLSTSSSSSSLLLCNAGSLLRRSKSEVITATTKPSFFVSDTSCDDATFLQRLLEQSNQNIHGNSISTTTTTSTSNHKDNQNKNDEALARQYYQTCTANTTPTTTDTKQTTTCEPKEKQIPEPPQIPQHRQQQQPSLLFDEMEALSMMAHDLDSVHGSHDENEEDNPETTPATNSDIHHKNNKHETKSKNHHHNSSNHKNRNQNLRNLRRWSYETLLDPAKLQEAAVALELGMERKNHRSNHGKVYQNDTRTTTSATSTTTTTFLGCDAVDFLLSSGYACTRSGAVEIANAIQMQYDLFRPVRNTSSSKEVKGQQETVFRDDYYFYQFIDPKDRHGGREGTLGSTILLTKEDASTAAPDASSWHSQKHSGHLKLRVVFSRTHPEIKKKSLEDIAVEFERGVIVKDRKYRLTTYKDCFVGRSAVSFLVGGLYASSRTQAIQLGQKLMDTMDLFEHVTRQHDFEDKYLFYRFKKKDERRMKEEDSSKSITDMLEEAVPSGLARVAQEFRENVLTKTNTYRFKKYRKTFVGSEAVDFLVDSSWAKTRKDAVSLGRELQEKLKLFHHVTNEHLFKDDFLFYRYDDSDTSESYSSSISGSSATLDMLSEIANAMLKNIKVKNRWYHLKLYKNCFLGTDAVTFLVESGYASTRHAAVALGREIAEQLSLFEHVERDHDLNDEPLFYRFNDNYKDRTQDESIDVLSLKGIAEQFEGGVEVKSNRYRLRVYRDTFVGQDAVSFMVNSGMVQSRPDAVALGRKLASTFHLFEHVTRDHKFDDKLLFYRFISRNMRIRWEELEDLEEENASELLSATWVRKLDAFGKKATARHLDSKGSLSLTSRIGSDGFSQCDDLKLLRLRIWMAEFRRLDPRWRILNFFNEVTQLGANDISSISLESVHPLLWFFTRCSVFTVWRPTAYDAIRKMMLGQAVGKGLDIKGKSAKRGKNSGFVPFLQIGENRHKALCRTIHKYTKIRMFFPSRSFHSREEVARYLEEVAEEMLDAVAKAKGVLEDRNTDGTVDLEEAKRTLLWDVPDLSITYLDEYSPSCYGIEIPSRLLWEALVMRQDCYRKPGSQYDPGRPSLPAFQDMNNAALQFPAHEGPRAVLWQNASPSDPLNVHELLMAYEEMGRVRPVVSDFDPFLVGTRRVRYDPHKGRLPPEQVRVLQWCIHQIGGILDSPTRPEAWTIRWLEVLKHAHKHDFHPVMPRFGFGDPKSYSIMSNAVERLTALDGSVRHGAESFNYYFPQELDSQYLVIADGLNGNVPWKYMDETQLREFLSNQIDHGFTFPLNPKWIMCDPFWKELYDKLLRSDREDVQNSMTIWFPPDSGVREALQDICARHPEGFVRGLRQ